MVKLRHLLCCVVSRNSLMSALGRFNKSLKRLSILSFNLRAKYSLSMAISRFAQRMEKKFVTNTFLPDGIKKNPSSSLLSRVNSKIGAALSLRYVNWIQVYTFFLCRKSFFHTQIRSIARLLSSNDRRKSVCSCRTQLGRRYKRENSKQESNWLAAICPSTWRISLFARVKTIKLFFIASFLGSAKTKICKQIPRR